MFPTNTVGARIARPFIGFGVFVAEGHVLLRKGYEQVRVAAPTMNNNVSLPTEPTNKLPQGVYTFGMQNLKDKPRFIGIFAQKKDCGISAVLFVALGVFCLVVFLLTVILPRRCSPRQR